MDVELLEEKLSKPNFFHRIAKKMLSTGALPRHICIIMDGNRRWAKQNNLPRLDGHKHGVKALDTTLHWMEDLDIPEATFYAFSTDNFNRSEEEVASLMSTFAYFLDRMIKKSDSFKERGLRVCIFGNLDLLPAKLRSLSTKLMLLTKDNKKRRVNMAIVYKSSEEIERAAALLKTAVQSGQLLPTDIDQRLFEKCLYTGSCSHPPDFLIRTSGEYRLSDFLLWQCTHKLIYITNKKWPELSFSDLFKALFYYQRHERSVNRVNKLVDDFHLSNDECGDSDNDKDVNDNNCNKDDSDKRNNNDVKQDSSPDQNDDQDQDELKDELKIARISRFLNETEKRRDEYLRCLSEMQFT